MLVGQHLEFDVARILQKLLHIHHRIVECRLCFGFGHGNRVQQRGFGMHHAHPASAAAAGSLDNDRITNAARDLDDFGGSVGQCAFHARHAGYTGFFHRDLGAYLVAHQPDGFGARADEHEAAFFDALGKIGVLGKETIAGVDGLRVGDFRRTDDGGYIQVALRRRRRADANRLVGQLHILGIGIRFGMHHDGLNAHFAAGALDAQGYFTAVGN